jgi:Asp-tRNA(Asn)/Glu-tRNA(Gln) amidotransferase C subunit
LLMNKFTDSIVEKVAKVANLSSKMKNDASFARQLRRRFT